MAVTGSRHDESLPPGTEALGGGVIPVTQVSVGDDAVQLVVDVLRGGQLAQGPVVAQFEDRFAELVGCAHAIAVNNGTSALIAALRALDLQPGDEVITSPFTFVATLNAILDAGATARFADISAVDFNLDPESAAGRINSRTKAILPVHLYGQCADLDRFEILANRHGLALVEDCAQAHGATIGERCAGSVGVGCFSFYATKNITTGEGGMITTSDDGLADRLRVLRNQGMRSRYCYEMVGGNYRMTELQAAVGLPQIDSYQQNVEARQANAAKLTDGLAAVRGLVTPAVGDDRSHVWHQYTVRVKDEAAIARDDLVELLQSAGVGCGVYYPRLVFDHDCFHDHPQVKPTDVPVAAMAARQVLSLPVHPGLSAPDLDAIIEAVTEALT